MGLHGFERRLEALVEGVFSRAFRSGLQPVEIGRRLAREMDDQRTVGVHGLIAPNSFRVRLGESDRARFEAFETTLLRELADAARSHARDEGYGFLGQIIVSLETDPDLNAGQCAVAGAMLAGWRRSASWRARSKACLRRGIMRVVPLSRCVQRRDGRRQGCQG